MSCSSAPRVYQDEASLAPRCNQQLGGSCPCRKNDYWRYRVRCCPQDQITQPRSDLSPSGVTAQQQAILAALQTVTAAQFEASGVVTAGLNIFDIPTIDTIVLTEGGVTVTLGLYSTGDPGQVLIMTLSDSPNQATDLANLLAVLTVTSTADSPDAGASSASVAAPVFM